MCGIAGYIGTELISDTALQLTLDKMRNRGPDNLQYLHLLSGKNNAYLLHSRLSIIDLDNRSNQPFTIGDCTVIYNGEIYNYIELRERIAKEKNVTFKTQSDTEVLLQYYIHFGEKCVDYFEGMWSFAIHDKTKNKLFLSRDRFAEKPLYYLKTSTGIYFGSEVKFIQALSGKKLSVNHLQLFRYLVNGYKSLYKTGATYFTGIQELSFASNATVDENLNFKTYSYWRPHYAPVAMSMDEAIEGVRHHLMESIRIRLRSDVPLAFCLSGGVDSAGITSIAGKCFNHNVSTFSIIDPDVRYNEYDNIKATVDDLGCQNMMIELNYDNSLQKLKQLITYHDAPIATINYFVHSFLSEAIAKSGCKVVFSGTAADELFTGYYDHFNLFLYEIKELPEFQLHVNNWQQHVKKHVRNPYLQKAELYLENPKSDEHIYMNCDEFASYLKQPFHEAYTEEHYTDSLLRNRMLNEVFHDCTRVILHEDDLNSMKYSIENRSPYLDKRLFEFAYSIPNELLMKDGFGKYILREALKGILNDKVRLDRQKKGFNASIHSIINFDDKSQREYLLEDSPIFELIKKDKIIDVMKKKPLQNSFSKFLFNFINAKIFIETTYEA